MRASLLGSVSKNGKEEVFTLMLSNKADQVDWLDAKIDRNTHEINIEIRPEVSDGGIEGTNTSFTPIGYEQFKNIAQAAIGYFWSRDGSRGDLNSPIITPEGTHSITVDAQFNKKPHMNANFSLIEKLDEGFGRSTSLWGFRSIYLNRGEFNYKPVSYALLLFRKTVAHEIGPGILLGA